MNLAVREQDGRRAWKRVALGDVTVKITKGTTPTTVGGRFVEQGVNFLKVESINESGSLDKEKIAQIDEESDEMLQRSRLIANDVLFSIAGAIGRTYLVRPEDLPANVNQALAIVRFDTSRVFPKYGYYALRDRVFQAEAAGRVVQCAQANVNLSQLSKSSIYLPQHDEQERIASILSAYDGLIENNRRRIQLLEQAARLLYKEWFVHLRFPGHEHVKIKNGVPEGWEKKKISDVCETIGGGTPSTKVPDYWDGDVTWVVPSDVTKNDCLVLLDSERKISESGLKQSSAKLVPSNTILMTSRASVGFFALMEREVCTNQGFINIIPHEDEMRMYLLFNLMSRVEEIRSNAKGTTYPEISKGRFREIDVVIPSKALVNELSQFANDIIHQVRILKRSTLKLKRARDILLPRLMNGEVAV